MKLLELVNKTKHIKRFRFLIYENDVADTKIYYENKTGRGSLTLYKNDLPNHYDIGYSYCYATNQRYNSSLIASFIDYWKVFELDILCFDKETETLDIILKIRKKGA